MLNIPDPVKDLFKLDSCRKNFRVHFPNGEMDDLTNADMVQESVEFSESICSQNTFKFGLSESSTIEFETVGVGNMLGMLIDCGIEIDLSSLTVAQLAAIAAGTWDGYYVAAGDSDIGYGYFHVPYGRFTVRSCPRDHRSMTHRRVTAYTDTRNLESRYQKALMDAYGYKNTYTPKFQNLFYASAGTNNEEILLDAGYDKTLSLAISDGRESTYSDLVTFGETLFRLDVHARNFNIFESGGSASYTNDAVYGLEGFEKIKNSGLIDSIAEVLVTDYGVPESEAYDKTKYDQEDSAYFSHPDWNSFATVRKPKIIGIVSVSTASTPYFEYYNPYVDISGINGLYCISPDRSLTRTRISVVSELVLTPWTGTLSGGSATGDPISSLATGLDEAFVNQYAAPSGSQFGYTLNLKSTGSKKDSGEKIYTFADSMDISKLLTGYLEIGAYFASPDRRGGLRIFRIDNSAFDQELSAGDYSGFWWDEYDVSPIGKVSYTLANDKNSEEMIYDFGPGQSVYSMKDNEYLKMAAKTRAEIEATLASTFVPHIGAVNFTPIEMTVGNGMPYIEAGDYIKAVAEDGAEAKSFNLSNGLRGIQHLIQTIESSGGDLMNETSDGGE